MKVCHLTTVHKPSDDRIYYKECRSLLNQGYRVALVAPKQDKVECTDLDFIPIRNYKNRYKRFFFGSWQVLRKSLGTKSELYHFHDPELLFVGVILRVLGKKVIYDVHEDLSKQILYKDWITFRFIRFLASYCVSIVERLCSSVFNGIVTATEDIAENFTKKKTIVVRNFPIVSMIPKPEKEKVPKQNSYLVYAGGISRIRGISEIVKALELLDGKAKLILLGEFDDKELLESLRFENGWKYVIFEGWKPLQDVYSSMKQAGIGIATLYPAKNYLKSLPVKAFEYMALGLPMILSDFPYWKKIFGSCSLFVDPKDPQDIADKISQLIQNPDNASQLGLKGMELVKTSYSWEKEVNKLFKLYKDILAK